MNECLLYFYYMSLLGPNVLDWLLKMSAAQCILFTYSKQRMKCRLFGDSNGAFENEAF